jgi:hypothetical protein
MTEQCVPPNRDSSADRAKHASEHCTDCLWRPFQLLRVRADVEPLKVGRGIMSCGIADEWNTELRALVVHELRRFHPLLGESRCGEEGKSEAGFQVPFDVTMEEPRSRVIGKEPHGYRATWRDLDRVSP